MFPPGNNKFKKWCWATDFTPIESIQASCISSRRHRTLPSSIELCEFIMNSLDFTMSDPLDPRYFGESYATAEPCGTDEALQAEPSATNAWELVDAFRRIDAYSLRTMQLQAQEHLQHLLASTQTPAQADAVTAAVTAAHQLHTHAQDYLQSLRDVDCVSIRKDMITASVGSKYAVRDLKRAIPRRTDLDWGVAADTDRLDNVYPIPIPAYNMDAYRRNKGGMRRAALNSSLPVRPPQTIQVAPIQEANVISKPGRKTPVAQPEVNLDELVATFHRQQEVLNAKVACSF
jgi:hypothetical protein